MPLVEFKERNTIIKSRTLSNVQMELIKLYSTNLEYDDLMEVKKNWLIILLKKQLIKLTEFHMSVCHRPLFLY